MYKCEPAPIIAPGVIDIYNDNGEFESRWYDGQEYDQNGDPVFHDSDEDD